MSNKALLLFFILIFGFNLQAQNSENKNNIDIKIEIGGTLTTLFADDITGIRPKYGLSGGLSLQFNNVMPQTGIRTGILYESKGFKAQNITFSLNYLTIPIHLVFGASQSSLFYFGPDFNILFNPKATKDGESQNIENGIRKFETSASFGVITPLSKHISINAGIAIGLMSLVQDTSNEIVFDYVGKNLMFPIRLTYKL